MGWNNDVFLIGRLGQDPEIKGKVTKFSIAVWQGKEKESMWVNCISFDDVPFAKGQEIKVSGRLNVNKYQGKESWQVIADTVKLKEQKKKDDDFDTEDDVPL